MLFKVSMLIDPLQVFGITVAIAGTGGAIATQDTTLAVFGAPVSVVLAGLAGAAGVLGFLPSMVIWRAILTVFFSWIVGVAASVPALKYLSQQGITEMSGAQMLLAGLIAAVCQLVVPLIVARRELLADRMMGKVAPPTPPPEGGA